MEERCFTFFPKLLRVAGAIPDAAMRGEFLEGVAAYGVRGEEPGFAWPLDAMFEGVREDIDNSVRNRYENRGGRPRSGGAGHGRKPARDAETQVPADGGDAETQVPADGNPGSGGSGNPGTQTKPSQAKPSQAKPGQAKGDGAAAAGPPRFSPPSEAEVAAYAAERGLDVDAGRFCDFYASKGWKVGRSPMRDWRAAARNWARGGGKGAGHDGAARPAWLDEYGG